MAIQLLELATSIKFGHLTVTSHLPHPSSIPAELQQPTPLAISSGMLRALIVVEMFHPPLVQVPGRRHSASYTKVSVARHGWL